MGNCLVTKLKGTVDDVNLDVLGGFIVTFPAGGDMWGSWWSGISTFFSWKVISGDGLMYKQTYQEELELMGDGKYYEGQVEIQNVKVECTTETKVLNIGWRYTVANIISHDTQIGYCLNDFNYDKNMFNGQHGGIAIYNEPNVYGSVSELLEHLAAIKDELSTPKLLNITATTINGKPNLTFNGQPCLLEDRYVTFDGHGGCTIYNDSEKGSTYATYNGSSWSFPS